ncbi:hypothetical protein B0T16DRAFT_186450 [Cercophora newfieldiana]|uniref:Uncharacterized protein n=1 Tax=Cercophora newfieldiana TaxID=92897 RepID=A0AA39Y1X5_9PEZI|nr:hypothetical protein B0T16DRAFT_186450 [Cercophora newfieldiana]
MRSKLTSACSLMPSTSADRLHTLDHRRQGHWCFHLIGAYPMLIPPRQRGPVIVAFTHCRSHRSAPSRTSLVSTLGVSWELRRLPDLPLAALHNTSYLSRSPLPPGPTFSSQWACRLSPPPPLWMLATSPHLCCFGLLCSFGQQHPSQPRFSQEPLAIEKERRAATRHSLSRSRTPSGVPSPKRPTLTSLLCEWQSRTYLAAVQSQHLHKKSLRARRGFALLGSSARDCLVAAHLQNYPRPKT